MLGFIRGFLFFWPLRVLEFSISAYQLCAELSSSAGFFPVNWQPLLLLSCHYQAIGVMLNSEAKFGNAEKRYTAELHLHDISDLIQNGPSELYESVAVISP